MTDVQLPDGSIASFPDGMNQDDVLRVVQNHVGASTPETQVEGAMRYPAMAGSYLAKGAAQGVGAIGDLQNLMQRGVNVPADMLARAFGASPPDNSPQSALSSDRLAGYGKAAGIVDRPDLQPRTTGEKYLAATAEGVGGMLPFAPLGAGSLGANLARGAAQGGAAGAGGEGAAELFPNHPTLARLGGNIIGAMGGAGAFNAGNRIAGAATGAATPTIQAYRELGITPSLVGDVSDSPTLRMVQAYAAKAPGGAGRVRDASESTVGQWGQALDNTAANYGTSRTMQEAGEAVQNQANNWLNTFKAENTRAWNQLDMYVPKSTPVPVTNYATTLGSVRSAMPNAPATAETLQPALSKNLLDALAQDIQRGPLTFQDVKAIRTRIGEKLAEPQLVGDTSYTDLKRIYGALSDDLGTAVAQKGPAAQNAFAAANAFTRQGHEFVENVLSKVIRGTEISPEKAASAALSGAGSGGTTLNAMRQQMPQAADELAAFKLRDMALANAGQQGAGAARLSPGTFVTDYAKISPEAAQALYGNDSRVRALATVGDSMKQTERMLNTSNTGSYQAMRDTIGALVPGGAIAGAYAGNGPGAAVGALTAAIAPWLSGYGAARFSTSPALASLLSSRAAELPSAALHNRAAVVPPALRALLAGFAGQQ